jgi:hypothetical protein
MMRLQGCRCLRIVRDHYYRLIETTVEFLKHVEDDAGVFGVEISGGLIRQRTRAG